MTEPTYPSMGDIWEGQGYPCSICGCHVPQPRFDTHAAWHRLMDVLHGADTAPEPEPEPEPVPCGERMRLYMDGKPEYEWVCERITGHNGAHTDGRYGWQ